MVIENVNYSRIWRYVEAKNVLPDLRSSRLHCHRIDLFHDEFEGFEGEESIAPVTDLPSQNLEKETSSSRQDRSKGSISPPNPNSENMRIVRKNYFASCWTTASPQNMQMWNAFAGKENNWVALESTFQKLHDALPDTYETLKIGTVAYFPEKLPRLTSGDPVDLLFRKREAFEYEREIRVVVAPSVEKDLKKMSPFGVFFKLETTTEFITGIVCHPRMESSEKDRLENEVKAIGLKINVSKSSIRRSPSDK